MADTVTVKEKDRPTVRQKDKRTDRKTKETIRKIQTDKKRQMQRKTETHRQ